MIKYAGCGVTFQEVPNEVSLSFSISNCSGNCEGCHSPWLKDDVGKDLENDLPALLNQYCDSITCVCFMGEGIDPISLLTCVEMVRRRGLKVALYSGRDSIYSIPFCRIMISKLNFIKIGSYRKELGGLDSYTTNQRMYKITDGRLKDITYMFWNRKSDVNEEPKCEKG